MTCAVCGQPARVHDVDNDVYYCDLHGDERLVCAGNHEHLPEQQP